MHYRKGAPACTSASGCGREAPRASIADMLRAPLATNERGCKPHVVSCEHSWYTWLSLICRGGDFKIQSSYSSYCVEHCARLHRLAQAARRPLVQQPHYKRPAVRAPRRWTARLRIPPIEQGSTTAICSHSLLTLRACKLIT